MGGRVDKNVELHMLGPCRLFVNSQAVLPKDWKSKKALTLFKYLATHRGRMVRREILLDLLWPDEDPEKASRSLYTAIYSIRRALEPDLKAYKDSTYIRYSNGMYTFDPGTTCWIDAAEFEQLYREGSNLEKEDPARALPLFQKAFGLYRGDFLAEEAYADWAVPTRDRLREMFISMGRRLAHMLAQDKNTLSDAIRVCRRVLIEDPYREELHQATISYLIEAGRFAEAAVRFRELEKLLREEFGIPPSPESQRLYEKMQLMARVASRSEEADDSSPDGPLVCDIKTFNSIHSLALRSQERHKIFHTLIRISMADRTESKEHLTTIFDLLKKILRRGDALCFNGDHILLHLPHTDQEGSGGVRSRIEKTINSSQIPETVIEVHVFEPTGPSDMRVD